MFFLVKFWLKKGLIYTHTGGGEQPRKKVCVKTNILWSDL